MQLGARQTLIIRKAVADGKFVAVTRTDKNSALHAHDRGLLKRGDDSSTYLPTPLAQEALLGRAATIWRR